MRKILLGIIVVLMSFVFVACGQGLNDQENGLENGDEVEKSEDSKDASGNDNTKSTEYPLHVTDATGEKMTIEESPERIVSTSPSETEILFALGLDDGVVGVSDFDDYPEEALSKTKVGGVINPDVEAIMEEEPDFVFTGVSLPGDVADKLRDLDLPLYQTDVNSIDDILDNITDIGVMTDRQQEAEKLVGEMKDDIDAVKEKAQELDDKDKKKVYIEFSPGWTVGKGEFMDELITIAGGKNVASDTRGWNEINEEDIIQKDPDVIIYADDVVDEDSGEKLGDLIKSRSGWGEITAVKNDQMIAVDNDLLSRLGPRVTEGLQEVAEGIYPDLYQE